MSDVLTKFRELTRAFDPIHQPQEAKDIGAGTFYVPEIHEGYRKQLEAALELNDNAKLLVAGQPGCGKTTLLSRLATALEGDGRVVAFVDLEAQTSVQYLDPAEMYLAALAELLAKGGKWVDVSTLGVCRGAMSKLLGDEEAPQSR